MPRKLTPIEVNTRYQVQGLELLEPYRGQLIPVLTRCVKCNRKWKSWPCSISSGHGCQKCSAKMMGAIKQLDQREVESRFRTNRLELLEVYKGQSVKVLTRCTECNYVWKSWPLAGCGCPKCAKNLLLTNEEVLERFKANGVIMIESYKTSVIKIRVRCAKSECRYEWSVKPNNIFRGQGCPKCSNHLPLTQSEVGTRFSVQRLEMLEKYKGGHVPIMTRCIKCRHEWTATPSNVSRGHGCPKCAFKKGSELKRLPHSEVALRFDMKDLEILELYRDSGTHVLAKCKKCNFRWRTLPNNVSKGRGCPCCAGYGFQPSESAILYYVKVCNPFGESVYKIGITNKSVRERFSKDFPKITIIETWHFENGAEAFEMEQDILKDYDADRWTGPDILESGNDELFNRDVLGLDKGAGQLELVA